MDQRRFLAAIGAVFAQQRAVVAEPALFPVVGLLCRASPDLWTQEQKDRDQVIDRDPRP
ncbi:hypothetical protein [Methylobacterium sp. WSM2598]|uniref:hypothetical protein n=1 Tax=Methylobacterium sp. WSM2598 TaxID=398261 RepID=UPI0012F63A12|nr:hypothetical protein [Methylobacterium sp. WSM2598]